MTDIVKREETSFGLTKGKLVSKTSSFKQRVEASRAEAIDPNTMPNRICLMLDVSGSMATEEQDSKSRIDLLKEAVQNFVARCDFKNTSIAMKTFPSSRDSEGVKLSANGSYIIAASMSLSANGGTPLRGCVETALEEVSMTRGVIVSDGGATDWHAIDWNECPNPSGFEDQLLVKYKDLGIPLDCVHISIGTDGEDLLKRIAKATDGIFLKFTDVSAFSRAFGYLSPGFRAMLTSGSVSASEIGAKEVQK